MTGPLSRFLRYTTQDEPVLSAGLLAALALYLVDRWLHLTDDDLQLLGLLLVPVAGAVLARWNAYAPSTVRREVDDAHAEGYEDGQADAQRPARQNPPQG